MLCLYEKRGKGHALVEASTVVAMMAVPKLRKAQQPPLAYRGATPDADRAKQPTLVEPAATEQDLNPGDRVAGLGNFGVPTGEIGIVEKTNEDDALVKWDGKCRMRIRQPWLKKI
jgi:hypothetical protein